MGVPFVEGRRTSCKPSILQFEMYNTENLWLLKSIPCILCGKSQSSSMRNVKNTNRTGNNIIYQVSAIQTSRNSLTEIVVFALCD